jgi:hypothetical protein
MATIINTLEVVLEPPRPSSGPTPPATQPPPAGSRATLTPADLADVAERRARQMARIAAH